ncbi:hypothetical protein GGR03_000135 [Aurantimonas endophytica]|uniref:Uncharacterized protein n=1 Tax=Aurantimonas endophytica TaxID=1522175 RepID=A0A7W6H9J5_9HYPH|nr:hypothetical protein [Aurantimonas endophytica]
MPELGIFLFRAGRRPDNEPPVCEPAKDLTGTRVGRFAG